MTLTKRWLVSCLLLFVLFALAVLSVLGLLLGACGGGSEVEEGGPLPSAAEVLTKAVERAATMKTFHFRLEHENGVSAIPLGLGLTTAEGDVIEGGHPAGAGGGDRHR